MSFSRFCRHYFVTYCVTLVITNILIVSFCSYGIVHACEMRLHITSNYSVIKEKRFYLVYRFRSAKVSKYVKFPTILDIAPFCSKRTRNLPTFDEDQTKILYSLYGVVEHGGSIHGGHYVAYVKVRQQLERNNYRWNFLPRNQVNTREIISPDVEPVIPTGKWYYISDSHVSEVTEAKVLDAQAYLLFYERIL